MTFSLPSLLQPAAEMPRLLPEMIECRHCHRPRPAKFFTVYRVGVRQHRHKTCNRCRSEKRKLSPAQQRNRELIRQAKSRACSRCGHTFHPVCVELVPRVALPRSITTSWRWMREDKLKQDISKCDVVCENCRRTELVTPELAHGLFLAEMERAARFISAQIRPAQSDLGSADNT